MKASAGIPQSNFKLHLTSKNLNDLSLENYFKKYKIQKNPVNTTANRFSILEITNTRGSYINLFAVLLLLVLTMFLSQSLLTDII